MNGLDAFERSVRKSLEDFEVPYNSSDWARMEQALNSGGRTASPFATGTLWLLLAGATALVGSTYMLMHLYDTEVDNGTGLAVSSAEAPVIMEEPGDGSKLANASAPDLQASETVPSSSPDLTEQTSPPTEASNPRATGSSTRTKKNDPLDGAGTVIPIQPEPKPKNGFSTSLSEGCEGATVEFKVEGMPESGIYLWNFGDGNFSNKPNPTHTFTKPGKFTVSLSMSVAGVGTIENKPYTDMIVINETPQAGFNPLKQDYSGHVPFVHFENRSIGANRYHWDFGDGTTSQVAHPDHVYRKKGEYRVQLMVMNEAGCTDFLERIVRIDSDYNLLAPAVFSPNSDGQADTFMPEALKDLNVKFKLSIYEPTTGRLVFETTDATKPWTGRLLNRGELCATGEYVWMAEIQEGLHLGGVNFEGKVSLVR